MLAQVNSIAKMFIGDGLFLISKHIENIMNVSYLNTLIWIFCLNFTGFLVIKKGKTEGNENRCIHMLPCLSLYYIFQIHKLMSEFLSLTGSAYKR